MFNNEFNLIAHRGYSEKSPENTINSFDLALEKGFYNFEFDVQLTKDKIPIVIHDDNLVRTSGIKGVISNMNYSELRHIEVKNKFNTHGSFYIPKLDEVLIRYKNKAHLHLELKSRDQDLSQIVYNYLEKYNWLHSEKKIFEIGGITISSFYIEQIIRFNFFCINENTSWLIDRITPNDLIICSKNKIDMICPKASNSEYNMVSEAYEKNISVRNWGIKDEKDLINAYNSGSKGTTIDWPTRGKEVILKYENNKISN